MPDITLKDIEFSVGEFPLLDKVNVDIHPKERIALIGRNGQGKSTLMKILIGTLPADAGAVLKPAGFKIAKLDQDLPPLESISVYEAVARGLQDLSEVLIQYHALITQTENHDDAWMAKITHLQERIEHQNGWHIQQRIDRIIQDLTLPADKKMSDLSGGGEDASH